MCTAWVAGLIDEICLLCVMMHRRVFVFTRHKLTLYVQTRAFRRMSDSAVDIAALTKSVEELGLKIRQMKNDGAPKGDVVVAVEQLKDLKAKLAAAVCYIWEHVGFSAYC